MTCQSCQGTGTDLSGGECWQCDGTGSIPTRLSMGGWIPPDNGPTPQDRYVKWLDANGYEDSPVRRAEFAGDDLETTRRGLGGQRGTHL